jgi:hypothetical protein
VADAARAAHVAQHLSDGDEAFANRRLLDFLRRDNAPWRRDVQKRRTVLRKALLEDEDRRRKLKKRKASTSANWACIRIVTHAQLLESRDVLGDARPSRIILVDVCFEAVRRIEAHATSHKIEVYALKLEGAADEARLSSLIAKERESFVRLIDERRLLAATSDMERHQSTKPKKARAIICDAREFRSSLPLALYGRGLTVVPSTLVVGDYVLAPDVVVERAGG